jgi:hypothetical protein
MSTEHQGDFERAEVIRWSGIWMKGREVRVGVRLADGRDGLLRAAWVTDGADPESEARISYAIYVMGQEAEGEVVVPEQLRLDIESRLETLGQKRQTMTLRDLKLF